MVHLDFIKVDDFLVKLTGFCGYGTIFFVRMPNPGRKAIGPAILIVKSGEETTRQRQAVSTLQSQSFVPCRHKTLTLKLIYSLSGQKPGAKRRASRKMGFCPDAV